MKKNQSFSLNIGLPTILLVFVVMCLLSFCILSFVSANADWNLCQKALERQLTYYETCNQAEIYLKSYDESLHTLYEQATTLSAYLEKTNSLPTQIVFPISDLQNLVIEAYPCPEPTVLPENTMSFDNSLPLSSSDTIFYKISAWKVVNKEDIVYDDSLHVLP